MFLKGGRLENLMQGRSQGRVQHKQCPFSSSTPWGLQGELLEQPHGNDADICTKVFLKDKAGNVLWAVLKVSASLEAACLHHGEKKCMFLHGISKYRVISWRWNPSEGKAAKVLIHVNWQKWALRTSSIFRVCQQVQMRLGLSHLVCQVGADKVSIDLVGLC